MTALQPLSLISLALGVAAILRFVWLDSLRFSDREFRSTDPATLSPHTARRLAMQAEAARAQAESEGLPRAA